MTFTYDSNNNVKTETRERTVAGTVVEETTTYEYDARDRVTKAIFPDGSYSETLYDLAGNTDKERDSAAPGVYRGIQQSNPSCGVER